MEHHYPSSREELYSLFMGWEALDESYHPLPSIYLGFLVVWSISALSWGVNTWRYSHFQMNKLPWFLASVPVMKALQMGSSYLFWSSCITLQLCSLWMSFGAYITGALFQTLSYVCFMLISYGYCIMCERLPLFERRRIAVMGLVLYVTLIGYRAALPYFSAMLMLIYLASFCIIFYRISHTLLTLREQLSYIEDENIHLMHEAIQAKREMFRKFQMAMQIAAVIEIAIHVNIDASKDGYWFRLMIREWVQFSMFLYIGWTFRSQAISPHFYIVPSMKQKGERALPPIHSIFSKSFRERQQKQTMEMDLADFKNLASQAWQVGVHTPHPSACSQRYAGSVPIIVQNPGPMSNIRE